MSKFLFFLFSLATWRIANMLVNEDGPWLIFERIRLRLGLQPPKYEGWLRETDPPGQMPGSLFNCVYCMSLWVASGWLILFAISKHVAKWLSVPFALSAISCLLSEWGHR